MITAPERDILKKLAEVWNAYCQLPKEHISDAHEFSEAIHRLQDMVAARATYRLMGKENEVKQRRNGDG